MTDFEYQILLECAEYLPASPWGAAVGVALEWLSDNEYIAREGKPTDKGFTYIKEKGHNYETP